MGSEKIIKDVYEYLRLIATSCAKELGKRR